MSEFIESKKASGIKAVMELKPKDLEGVKRELAELVYQLSALYDRWSVEHQQVARREAEFIRILSEFSKQVELIGKLGAEVQKSIQTTIAQAAVMVGDLTGKEAMKKFDQGINHLQQALSKAVYHASDLLGRYEHIYKQEHLKSWVRVISVGVLVGALVGFGAAWLYKPATSESFKSTYSNRR